MIDSKELDQNFKYEVSAEMGGANAEKRRNN